VQSAALALELAMPENATVPIDENGLSRCVRGHLVYEADLAQVPFAFPQRLLRGGLHSLVAAPLQSESRVFGVLIAARRQPDSFSSGECEFLRQLSAHVALAAKQAELHASLQRAYDDLRQTQQSVMQQERLRALGEMASGIAHDINNAISPITLYTENLLEREPNLSARGREQLQTIAMAIDDVAATVARMREFYRQREAQATLQPVQLNDIVRNVVEMTRARWHDMPQQRGAVVTLDVDLARGLPDVLGSEPELREALINLVFNAVDAMPTGGTLTLRTRRPVADGRPVLLEVTDTGVGMDEPTRRRCLEPFFTTKGERGTGLGLAMVYGVVQRHGADIEIESAVGQGTTIRIVLASVSGAGQPRAASLAPPAPAALLHVLLVDDDPIMLKTLSETLGQDGHTVTVASGGQAGIDAVHAARSAGHTFDVVVTDLGMPYVDGRRVAAAVKESNPATPVIMLTGWGQRLAADGEMPAHVDQMLSKPPKMQALRAALAQVTRREPEDS
jgi:signal transduction histidine kinase/ActR/RegA family two-component response regulator